MSLIKFTNLEKNRVEMEFGIDKTALENEKFKVYKSKVKKMKVPGYRDGKAPKTLIEKLYGKNVFLDDALNNLLPDAYEEAYKASGLKAVSKPTFDMVSMDDENAVILKAIFDVKPTATVKAYKSLKATREVAVATDEMVAEEMENARKSHSREVDITDRKTKLGDIATIDYEGFVDGVAFDGGKDEGHKLKLGSGQFIPGFEDQVVDREIGEEFVVNVSFPEDYSAEELKGKAAVFKCKLHAITFEELPELDDEFAKDLSFDTLEQYKADVREKINKRLENAANAKFENEVLNALLENLEVDVPESMYEAETENQIREYDMQLRSSGLDLNTYFKYTGQSLDQLRDNFKPRAERAVKVRLALETVANTENIVATDEEIENEYKRLSDMYQTDIERVKEAIAAEDLAEDIRIQSALKLVRESAEVVEAGENAKPAPKAKAKTAAKTAEKAEDGESAPKKTTTKSTTAKSTTAKSTTTKTTKTTKPKTEDSEK